MATAASSGHVVLVVDDNEMLRESLADLLSDEGCSVLTAVNGADALERLRRVPRTHPCLILLDLMMPVMDGREFYTQKQLDPELTSIPVVFMSAEGNLGRGAIPAGGEYLTKPMHIETVLGALERHCGLARPSWKATRE